MKLHHARYSSSSRALTLEENHVDLRDKEHRAELTARADFSIATALMHVRPTKLPIDKNVLGKVSWRQPEPPRWRGSRARRRGPG